jgi:hypothetical protein
VESTLMDPQTSDGSGTSSSESSSLEKSGDDALLVVPGSHFVPIV